MANSHSYKFFFVKLWIPWLRDVYNANILPKYFFPSSNDLSFPLRANTVKALRKVKIHISQGKILLPAIHVLTFNTRPPYQFNLPCGSTFPMSNSQGGPWLPTFPFDSNVTYSLLRKRNFLSRKEAIPFTLICRVVSTKQHGLVEWNHPFIQSFHEVINKLMIMAFEKGSGSPSWCGVTEKEGLWPCTFETSLLTPNQSRLTWQESPGNCTGNRVIVSGRLTNAQCV